MRNSTRKDPLTGLTKKQEDMAQGIANGLTNTEAYKQAYHVGDDLYDDKVNAYKTLKRNPKIMERVNQLRRQAEEQAILDRQARQALLTNFALDETVSNSDRLSAIDKLNKMSGDYSETIRNEVSGQIDVKEERHTVMENLLKECGIK